MEKAENACSSGQPGLTLKSQDQTKGFTSRTSRRNDSLRRMGPNFETGAQNHYGKTETTSRFTHATFQGAANLTKRRRYRLSRLKRRQPEPVDPRIPIARNAFKEQLAESRGPPATKWTTRRVFESTHQRGRVSAIIGARRCGKSTFLKQLRQERIEQGIPLERLPLVSFNDIRFSNLAASDLRSVIFEYNRRHLSQQHSDGPPVTWYFDDIHAASGWDSFVTRLVAFERADAFLTGDSSALDPSGLAPGMFNRLSQIHLHPFSFEEALRHQGLTAPHGPNAIALLTGQELSNLKLRLLDWLSVGGLPELQGKGVAERRKILGDHLDLTILRDTVERRGARNITAIRMLAHDIIANAGKRYSLLKFCAALETRGISLSMDTARQYLKHLEDSLLFRAVGVQLDDDQESSTHARKLYPADTGFISIFDPMGSLKIDKMLETSVFLELKRRGYEITYMRFGKDSEIDFVALGPDGGKELVQVCSDLSDLKVAEKKLKSLSETKGMGPSVRRLILVLTRGIEPAEIPAGVELLTAGEWLLEQPE